METNLTIPKLDPDSQAMSGDGENQEQKPESCHNRLVFNIILLLLWVFSMVLYAEKRYPTLECVETMSLPLTLLSLRTALSSMLEQCIGAVKRCSMCRRSQGSQAL